MPSNDSRLGGRTRTRLNAAVRARTLHPVCPMCGYPIDRTLQRTGKPHPLSSVVDEWYPRSLGGDVADHNCVEVHRTCNGSKGDRWPVTASMRAACRTKVEQILELHIEPGPLIERDW